MFSRDQLEKVMGFILLVGLLASIILVLVGGLLFLWQSGQQDLHFEMLNSDFATTNIKQIWHIASSLSPLGIVELGLFALVATQILRIMLLVWYYLYIRDYWFTGFSTFILVMLIYSFFWRKY